MQSGAASVSGRSTAASARAALSLRPSVCAVAHVHAFRSQPQHQMQHQRGVQVRFFKFGKNGFGAEAAGIVGSQGRDEYTYDDVEQYFNYMGFLAEEGTYDRMEALLKSGLHPIDVILVLACMENDTPKVGEILNAGADVRIKSTDGRTPLEIATKADVQALLQQFAKRAV
eukprot:CAMPEP_0119101148 /NCGR_PEP_ID=MMETSP1180-20130426/273_1 /TAXON_ID=3052 ORGANISM="Chlamydomonas cf sp, Strain CCMP681" /NCGR_SAMPLE_ID=MMETSP1180 /ASSEMBLY_ACC=CAM_ASM_000741 /LENGTH=170 /DNA_ID=CAMNT_0007085211 /DNA_START=44 /DNA_END=556 /DNA_ORIENTATION=-